MFLISAIKQIYIIFIQWKTGNVAVNTDKK